MSGYAWWAVAGTAVVLAVTFGIEEWLRRDVTGKVWRNLSRPRKEDETVTKEFTFTKDETRRRDERWTISWTQRGAREPSTVAAFTWASERYAWAKEASAIRTSFLARTQATAEKWRTVFAGLLGIFGAVLVVKPTLAPGVTLGPVPYFLTMAALVLGAQAVAYTGWAAAGLPKYLVDVDAETAFVEVTSHAARSLARLRVGLVSGALASLALIGGLVVLLAPEG